MEKRCKECGKLFIARNSRTQYCDRPHYRPCPVCGEPVLIKYLSDPTPRCINCRSKGARTISKQTKYSVSEGISHDSSVKRYVGKTVAGFVNNQIYNVRLLKNPPYGYTVAAIGEVLNGHPLILHISSMISYHQLFEDVDCTVSEITPENLI